MTSHLVNLKAKQIQSELLLIQQTGFTILEIKTAAISMSVSGASSMIFIVARALTE